MYVVVILNYNMEVIYESPYFHHMYALGQIGQEDFVKTDDVKLTCADYQIKEDALQKNVDVVREPLGTE